MAGKLEREDMGKLLKVLLTKGQCPSCPLGVEWVGGSLARIVCGAQRLFEQPARGQQVVAQPRGDDHVVLLRPIFVNGRAEGFQGLLQRQELLTQICEGRFERHCLPPRQL
jgi:hypothetical protein